MTKETAIFDVPNTPAQVKALLKVRHHLGARKQRGDTAASDILLDLAFAIGAAQLTERQTEAIALVYGFDVTQAQAAEIMGITQQAVGQAIDGAAVRIAAVYKRKLSGGVSAIG